MERTGSVDEPPHPSTRVARAASQSRKATLGVSNRGTEEHSRLVLCPVGVLKGHKKALKATLRKQIQEAATPL